MQIDLHQMRRTYAALLHRSDAFECVQAIWRKGTPAAMHSRRRCRTVGEQHPITVRLRIGRDYLYWQGLGLLAGMRRRMRGMGARSMTATGRSGVYPMCFEKNQQAVRARLFFSSRPQTDACPASETAFRQYGAVEGRSLSSGHATRCRLVCFWKTHFVARRPTRFLYHWRLSFGRYLPCVNAFLYSTVAERERHYLIRGGQESCAHGLLLKFWALETRVTIKNGSASRFLGRYRSIENGLLVP